MNEETKKLIAKAAHSYITTHGMSQSDLAKKANVRTEYLSHILRNIFVYNAGADKEVTIAEQYFMQLAGCIGYNVGKVYWPTKPTDQLTAIIAILEESKAFGDIRVIVADTGAGKTHTAKLFAQAHPTDVFRVVAGSSDNLSDLIDKTIEALGIVSNGSTKSKRLRGIIHHLRGMRAKGKRPQIIYDEAEFMNHFALCSIKELYDGLIEFCSIILIGTPQIVTNLERLKKRNKNGIPQFYRRVKYGIRHIPSIDRSFGQFLEQIEDKALRRFLVANCENYGELHDVLVPTMREADRLAQPVTLDLVKQVLNLEGLGN